jgi:hypothetical protein
MRDYFDENNEHLYKIFDPIVKKNELYSLGKEFVLVNASMNMLRNFHYKNTGCIVEKDCLTRIFGNTFKYENSEIVLPMFELTQTTALVNISLYDKQFGIENMRDILALTSFYNKKYKKPVMEQLANHLSDLKESQFWSDPRNCNINMTDAFMTRGFNYKEIRDEHVKMSITAPNNLEKKDKEIERIINILTEGKKKDTDYLNFIHKNDVYTDIFSALKSSGKRTYYMTSDDSELKCKESDIVDLLCSIEDEQELYYAFNTFLVSKEYCHMVINNSKVLDKVKPLFDKYAPVYKLLLGYAWLCFAIEESIMKTKAQKENRFVFDINTANKLPVFPFITEDLTQNPYLTILVNKKILNSSNNVMSLDCINGFDGYGVCTLDQFKWRFNLFTTGDPSKNIFDGIDWKYFAVSGSMIPACLQKKSPLFDLVTHTHKREEDKWLTFFNHYYNESDIDMMCNDLSIFGFTDKVHHVVEQIKKNISTYKEGDVSIEPVKSMAVLVTKYFFEERLQDFNEKFNDKFTVEHLINQLGSAEMREYLYWIYSEHKMRFNCMIRKTGKNTNPYINNFLEPISSKEMNIQLVTHEHTRSTNKSLDSDMCFYINDFRSKDDKVPEEKNFMIMKICENVRFKIKSPKMLRCIELFRSKSSDFFALVARFHLPCVRAYYQGNNVYILPSCVSALMTGVNIDYKYFAGVRDPIDIINKYRMRGFSTLLSDKEKQHMAFYNNNIKTFGGMFHIESTNKNEINKSFGPRELTDKIFQPHVYIKGLDSGVYNLSLGPKLTYIKTLDDLKDYYAKKYDYDTEYYALDLFKFRTVNEYGSVTPFSNWIPKAYLDMRSLNATKQPDKYNSVKDKYKSPYTITHEKPKDLVVEPVKNMSESILEKLKHILAKTTSTEQKKTLKIVEYDEEEIVSDHDSDDDIVMKTPVAKKINVKTKLNTKDSSNSMLEKLDKTIAQLQQKLKTLENIHDSDEFDSESDFDSDVGDKQIGGIMEDVE